MGKLNTGPEVLDDIILIKKDGLPTYNFAHIVDDTTMNITHVMRGIEYISSTPNYLAIYEALGVNRPCFVSLPHILAPSGNKKLGKRDGAKSVTEYRADGILPETMLNYLACLGWNDGTEQEIYTKQELIQKFSLDRIQSSGARYDENKLLWLNGQWIRKIYTEQGIDALFARTLAFWPENATSHAYQKQVLSIIYDRLKTLSELKTFTTYFFTEPTIDLNILTTNKFLKHFSKIELANLLKTAYQTLLELKTWDANSIQTTLNSLLISTNTRPAELFSLIRIAISFAPFSPALHLTLHVLDRTRSLSRLKSVIKALS